MSSTMDPSAFAKLDKAGMQAELKRYRLAVSGNKPGLLARYTDWFNKQLATGSSSNAPAASDQAGPSSARAGPSATTTTAEGSDDEDADNLEQDEVPKRTVLDPTAASQTVSMLSRVFIRNNLKVSSVVKECIAKLDYTPGKQFRTKAGSRDLSDILQPLLHFTEAFLRTLDKVPLTSFAGVNHVALRLSLEQQFPKVVAVDELAPFFAAWNIRVVSSSKSPPPIQHEDDDSEIQMAMQASMVTARAEAASRGIQEQAADVDEEKAEAKRKVLLAELDVMNSALQHRLARWARTFPRPKLEDMMWPMSYNDEEKKQIKGFIRNYLDDNDLWSMEISADDQQDAILGMKDHPDFPVEHGKIASIIQTIFIGLRKGRHRYSSASASASRDTSVATQSRSVSPVKGPSPARAPVRGTKRGRRSRGEDVADNDTAEENKGKEDEEEHDVRPAKRQRAARKSSLRQSYTVVDDEDDDE